jgi:transposase
MSTTSLTQDLLLPDLKFIRREQKHNNIFLYCDKVSGFEVCPHCAQKCFSVYDHVTVTIKDEPIRNRHVYLKIRKRRFHCKPCNRIFREPVGGIYKGFRTSERFRRFIRKLASESQNLKQVTKTAKCSSWLVYTAFYQQLELENKKHQNPWPKTLGIDEHSFIRNVKGAGRDFVTVFIDYTNRKMREVVMGKSLHDLTTNSNLNNIAGRDNVQNVVLDLSPTFRTFVQSYFPKAKMIADKFHVVKLMHPLIHEYRKKIILENELSRKRNNPVVRLLITYRKKLRVEQRWALDQFLDLNPEMKEVYWFQQRLYSMYRIKGYNHAREALGKLLDDMAKSKISQIHSYRFTLKKWYWEILNYFSTGLNNGRTEGYNRKAKLVQRNAYGFRSFKNYRLKLLYSCR